MARWTISPGIGIEEILTDDERYKDYVLAHYRKQGLHPLVADAEDGDEMDDYETNSLAYCPLG